MLKAMKEQLQTLAQTDKGDFHVNLRRRVGKKATDILEDKLREIIVLMPDLVTRIYFYWNRSRKPSEVRKLGGYLLTYLYTPKDFLSSEEWGLFGYLDDAYLVAKVYTNVIDDVRQDKGKVSAKDESFYQLAKYLKRYVRGVIPKETQQIDDMIGQIQEGKDQKYLEIFS